MSEPLAENQRAKLAVHWLRIGEPIQWGMFQAAKGALEVACGYALTAERFRTSTTEDRKAVTCDACLELINGVPRA